MPELSSTSLRLACMGLCFERAAVALKTDRPDQAAAFEVAYGAANLAAHAVTQENYVQAGVYLATVENALWDFDSHYLRECAVPRIHKVVAMLKGIYQKPDGAWVNGMDLAVATDVLGEAQEYVLRGVTLVVAEVERQMRLARQVP